MKRSLSIASVNLIYLITMILVITGGSLIQTINLPFGLIATEFVLILLPAIILLRIKKIPLRQGFRLNRIGPFVAIVSVLLGVATYLFSVLIESLMMQLTGMPPVDVPQNLLPQSTMAMVFYFIALAVAAPVCEEGLFRGVIQGTYESRKSVAFAITLPALLFAFYHMRLSGLPGLIPVAFILGFVAWRTRSIYASILVHFGMNASSATISLLQLKGSTFPAQLFGSIWTPLAGILAAIALLFLFIRLQHKPEVEKNEAEPSVGWFKDYWSLLVAGLLYLVVIAATLIAQMKGLTANTNLHFYPPHLEKAIESRYQAINRAGDVVGEMKCMLTPKNTIFTLVCTSEIQQYEVKQANSLWYDGGHTADLEITWEGSTFDLLEYSYRQSGNGGEMFSAMLEEGNLVTISGDEQKAAQLPQDYLIDYEWAWKVNDLDGTDGPLFKTPYVYLLRWDNATNQNISLIQDEMIRLAGGEKLDLPAGDFDTWKVTLGSQTAWYARDDAKYPRPVKFDDGMLTYELMQ